MSRCIISGCRNPKNIPLFSFPKNEERLKEWEKRVFPIDGQTSSKEGDKICIRHFERFYIENHDQKTLLKSAIPTLFLNKGNTIDDFEELLSYQKKPISKKKRGSSGLRNLQIARAKRNERKERMRKIAEMRRLAKLQNSKNMKEEKKVKKTLVYDMAQDYFLGEREESDNERVLISLRMTKNCLLKEHPSSIRNFQNFPLFNSIKHMEKLVENNPVFWDTDETLSFVNYFIPLKTISKRFKAHQITGETILNVTKSDLIKHLQLDEKTASILSDKFEQLRKETLMRYINC